MIEFRPGQLWMSRSELDGIMMLMPLEKVSFSKDTIVMSWVKVKPWDKPQILEVTIIVKSWHDMYHLAEDVP